MKTLILNGASGAAAGDRMASRIIAALEAHNPQAETVLLREQKIGNCAGDFFCWMRNPGICNTDDDNRRLAAKVMQSDLVVYLTPVTFGGYSSALKHMVDHQIQNISPFFTTVDGEIHHKPRYKSYPDLLVVGWMDTPDAEGEAVFRHLAYRNAINMMAMTWRCEVLAGDLPQAELVAQAGQWIDAIARREKQNKPLLPVIQPTLDAAQPARRALLLVGSPRTRKSTSASLGGYLREQLASRGVQTDVVQIYTSLNSAVRMQVLFEKLAAADLVVLAFPLYVDSLPAPVIAALEKIAAQGETRSSRQRFAAIANCGFPEAAHNATALTICAHFARQAGFDWAGGLALGGGEGIVHGVPLDDLDGRVTTIRQSLDLAADALAAGQPIPLRAYDLMARPLIPAWIYKLLGGIGWKRLARGYRVEKILNRRPYEVKGEPTAAQTHRS